MIGGTTLISAYRRALITALCLALAYGAVPSIASADPGTNGCGSGSVHSSFLDHFFQRACDHHDYCYADLRVAKQTCDAQLYVDAVEICQWAAAVREQDPTAEALPLPICHDIALAIWGAVAWGGEDAHREAQEHTRQELPGIWVHFTDSAIALSVVFDQAAGRWVGRLNAEPPGADPIFSVAFLTTLRGDTEFTGTVRPTYIASGTYLIGPRQSGQVTIDGGVLYLYWDESDGSIGHVAFTR